MAQTLATTILAQITAMREQGTDSGTILETINAALSQEWPTGTGNSKADEIFHDRRTIAAAAHVNFDLEALTQLDDDGATIRTVAFDKVKLILCINHTAIATGGYAEHGGGTDGGSAADAFSGAGTPLKDDGSIGQSQPQGLFWWLNPVGVSIVAGNKIWHNGGITETQDIETIIVGEAA